MEKWWDEEAERLDKMGKIAKKKKAIIKVGKGPAPELDKDGTEVSLERLKEIIKRIRRRIKK